MASESIAHSAFGLMGYPLTQSPFGLEELLLKIPRSVKVVRQPKSQPVSVSMCTRNNDDSLYALIALFNKNSPYRLCSLWYCHSTQNNDCKLNNICWFRQCEYLNGTCSSTVSDIAPLKIFENSIMSLSKELSRNPEDSCDLQWFTLFPRILGNRFARDVRRKEFLFRAPQSWETKKW